MHRGTNKKLEGTAYHFRCGHPDLLKTRFKKKKKKNFSLWTMQEQIAIKSGYQVSMHDRWWIHLTWDNFSNKFIWSKINYCQETLWKFHLKRVKKGELTAMNSLHSGLQNKDTYYLNQFYLRISNIDNSYKKHPSTGHRTASDSILRGANRH